MSATTTTKTTPNEQHLNIALSDGSSVSAVLLSAQTPVADGDLLILAHGAGQDINSAFMQAAAGHLASIVKPTLSVLRFNFQYMQTACDSGRRRPPDRAAKLEQCWREVADHARATLTPQRLFLGGKSMGGRMATMIVADGYRCDGLLLLGYPLHPPGKPDKLRSEHLPDIDCPMLFVQGTADRLCRLDLLEAILAALPSATTLHRINGGDHSFKLPKRLNLSDQQMFAEVTDSVMNWRSALPQQ